MNAKKQHGKGLAGFLSGLLLATAAIIGILFFLNKDGKNSFKESARQEKTASRPEILSPEGNEESESGSKPKQSDAEQDSKPSDAGPKNASERQSVESEDESAKAETEQQRNDESEEDKAVVALPPKKQSEQTAPKSENDTKQSAKSASDGLVGNVDSDRKAAQEQADKKAVDRKSQEQKAPVDKKGQTSAKPATGGAKDQKQKDADKRTDTKKSGTTKENARKTAKPTPEEILDSGSVEKAREAAREKRREEERARRVIEADNGKNKAERKAKSSDGQAKSGRKVYLQMGSYNQRGQADSQRAKLAMMGVSAGVVESEVNGKTVYRLQSGAIDSAEAKRIQQTLQRNGVSSFTRSAK
ncbi:SPOR domain-containing protein [Neisseria sp.]|uniref:SPOR domain-containing protein n=1 Tax=Neisseria sp. TaxID=192066 RepID=UPI0035A14917